MLTLAAVISCAFILWALTEALAAIHEARPVMVGIGDETEAARITLDKGGSVPEPPKQQKVELPPLPAPLPPPPAPLPPPTQDMSQVDQAKQDTRRKAARQNGMAGTLLAGETGGYQPADAAGAKKTLLG